MEREIKNKMTKKILVAEDNESLRNCYERVFKIYLKEKFDVLLAKDGKEEVELYKKNQCDIDAIVTDQDMPYKTGLEAALEIKEEARKNGNSVPIIMVTGGHRGLTEKFNEGKLPQIDYLIHKPFSNQTLIGAVEEYIQIYRENKK